jgi:acetyl-CoA carboxylase carboxyltransferase component
LAAGEELRSRPFEAAGAVQVGTQHGKGRMTVWERIDTLKDPGDEPTILFQNWGKNLDGASIVTGVTKVNGRDTALYGHDFTVRAGSMDATNGRKLANVMRWRASAASRSSA